MSTPLTDRINSLKTQANAKTGASDTTLSAAVATLIAGYGSGGITPWKTETLEVNQSVASRTVDWWMTYFGITEQSILDGNIYLLYFADNLADGSYAYIIIFYPNADGETTSGVVVRTGGTSATNVRTRYAWAQTGTTITIYKISIGSGSS